MCQHRNLCKLLGINAQKLRYGGGHRQRPADRLLRLAQKFRLGRAFYHAAAALGGTLLLGPAAHGVAAPAVGKLQFHAGLCRRLGKITAQHRGFSVFAGGFAVQGKGDSIKQRGLAAAGIAADQKQSAAAKGRKIQHGLPGVGTKGGQLQACRLHFCASSRIFFTAARSSSVRGRPFICSKKSSNNSAKLLPSTARTGASSSSVWRGR